MEVMLFKIGAVVLIFSVGVAGGMMPVRIELGETGRRRLTLGNSFSAGVFLGAGLLHMLPDALGQFSGFAGAIEYPLCALTCAGGFLLILLVEKGLLSGKEDLSGTGGGNRFYPYVLLLVLSIHSLIAGAALGLEDAFLASLAIFIAIIAHKGAAAFSLGVSLRQGEFDRPRHIRLIVLFSIMVPAGVLVGSMFSSAFSGTLDVMFEGIFDALAAGTFLYVGILEILSDVFEEKQHHWRKLILVFVGFALMAAIAIWT